MSPLRYTEKQILCGLRDFWTFEIDANASFDADTRVDLQLKAIGAWDDPEICLFDELEEFFHFTCQASDWRQLFGFDLLRKSEQEWEAEIGQYLTFGVLARFISERKSAVSFQPAIVMGRECGPAGVFFGLQCLTQNHEVAVSRVAPSTKIIDVLCGHSLDQFWSELRWISEHGVPDLPYFWRSMQGWGCFAGFVLILFAILLSILTESILFLIVMSVCAWAVWYVSLLYKQYSNPLPPELQTFRDLAVWIADHDCDAVRQSERGT